MRVLSAVVLCAVGVSQVEVSGADEVSGYYSWSVYQLVVFCIFSLLCTGTWYR